MAYRGQICYYRSGPIERDPGAAFHSKNRIDKIFTEEFGFRIVGDTFEYLKAMGCPQEDYGPKMRKFRNQGEFLKFCQNELLLTMSLRKVKQSDFKVIRPSAENSGGTTSEIVMGYLRGIPMLVIIGPHGESVLDNNSTFVIRMLTGGRYNIIFNTEKEVIDFVRKHLAVFKEGRKAIRQLIKEIKQKNPHINDRPKLLWDERFKEKDVIIQGWPGCGKDTQSRMLQDLCGFKFFGSGDKFRELYSRFPLLKRSLESGNTAPSELMIKLITDKLIGLEKFEPIVFAGTPKLLVEARAFIRISKFLDRKPLVIIIDIDEKLSQKRVILRRNCKYCRTSFCGRSFVKNPICPQCGGPLSSRKENIDAKARNKIMKWYRRGGRVWKVIRYFENLGLVTHVNGHQTKEKIFADILEILCPFGTSPAGRKK